MNRLTNDQVEACDKAITSYFGTKNIGYAKADNIAPFCYRLKFKLPSAGDAVADMQVRVNASVAIAACAVRIDAARRDDWIRAAVCEVLCRIASECPHGRMSFDFANSLLVARYDLPSQLFVPVHDGREVPDGELLADLIYTPLAMLDKYYAHIAGIVSAKSPETFDKYGAVFRLYEKTLRDAEEKGKTIKRLRDEIDEKRCNVDVLGTQPVRRTSGMTQWAIIIDKVKELDARDDELKKAQLKTFYYAPFAEKYSHDGKTPSGQFASPYQYVVKSGRMSVMPREKV